jgi:hypothetical protein
VFELRIISDKCRNLKIEKKEFFGGSMTITSLGGIGGSFFTPIINYPEVAILGIGRSQKKQMLIYRQNFFQDFLLIHCKILQLRLHQLFYGHKTKIAEASFLFEICL